MKHTKKKRVLALVLCMVLVLSTGIAAFANENVGLQSVACSATNLERVIKNADGEQIGTLTADVPEGAFFASSSDANIQMEVEADSGEAGVVNRVQQQMENEGITGYEISNYVMANVTFYVNGEKQTPQQPITFHMTGTNLNTENVMAFADDRQNTPVLMDATTDENGGLQFTAETSGAETVVYGVAEKTEAAADENADSEDANVNNTQEAAPEITTYAANDGITLTDDIIASGKLKANLTGNVATEIVNATSVTFTWKKQINNGSWTNVEQKKSGNDYNIPDANVADQWLDVALDGGALNSEKNQTSVKYKIEVTYTTSNGAPKTYSSSEQSINYWNELQNGSFENPALWYHRQIQIDSEGVIWKTTGSDKQIEIVRKPYSAWGQNYDAGINDYNWYGSYETPDGLNQFAELNAEAEGALYQDVLTAKGTPLNYWFSHRARGYKPTIEPEYDTMYVVIMPTQTALTGASDGGEIDTQDKLKTYMKSLGIQNLDSYDKAATENASAILYNKDGVLIRKIDSDDQSWHTYDDGTYVPTNNLTRFFFVAGPTAYDASGATSFNRTIGNFIDAVGFSYNLPPANPGTFNLAISKTISGTNSEAVRNNLKFTITSTTSNAPLNGTEILGKDAEWTQNADGNWIATWKFSQQKISSGSYQYTITETNANLDKYDRTTTINCSGVTNPSTDTSSADSASATFTVKEKSSASIAFTNSYAITDGAVEVGKTAKVDNWDDRTYDITLDASSLISKTTDADPVDIVMVFDKSGSMKFRSSLQKYNNGKKVTVAELFTNNSKGVYYYVANTSAATVYRVWKSNNTYYYIDDSYWDYTNNKVGSGSATKITESSKILKSNKSYVFYTTNDKHDRLYYLKEAAKQFSTELEKTSKDSRIALVTFTKEENKGTTAVNTDFSLKEIGGNASSLNATIDKITTAGGTQPSIGLDRAKEILQKNQISGRKTYVILMTDGCPADEKSENQYDDFRTAATQLKDDTNCTLMTIAVGLNEENANLKTAKDFLSEIATANGTGKYAYDAVNADELPAVFNQILGSITSKESVKGATVKDYIDPRFEVDEDSVRAAGGTVGEDDGGQYVIWTDQTIGPKTSSSGWSKTFKVKAKDNYIGGNDVTTNGPNSGVIVDGKIFTFPQPKVNVKIDLKLSDKEVTIYKGDSVPTDDKILNQLFDVNYAVNKYNNPKSRVNADDFTLTWYTKGEDGVERVVTKDEMANTKPEDTTQYYLRVTYNNAKSPSDESNANTTKNGKTYVADGTATNISDSTKDYGTYTINVISGTIRITKKVAVSDEERTFTFSIKDENGNVVKNITITIPANETKASVTVNKLARGSYVVSEDTKTDYSIEGVVIDKDTDCKNDLNVPAEDQATFVLGNNRANEDVISTEYTHTGAGILGAVTYTNEKVTTNWMIKKVSASDGGNSLGLSNAEFTLTVSGQTTPKYFGKSESDGMVFWYSDAGYTTQVEKLAAGTYELQETVAPNGYQCSTEKWTIVIAKNGSLKSVSTDSGTQITTKFETVNKDTADEKVITCYLYKDEAVYALPSTGGPGIYLFMIGGMLLMGVAAWILYKNKCREVLKR